MGSKAARVDRRDVLGWMVSGSVLVAASAYAGRVRADVLPPMTVYRKPSCGCCHKWVDHLTAAGFAVTVKDMANFNAIKAELGVPAELASCHTAEIGGYVIEGHVPAGAIKRLLAERPTGRGLAVPGMPIGSPGMEGGTPEVYDVILFGPELRQSFGRFREDKPV